MSKKILSALVMSALAFTSCIKDVDPVVENMPVEADGNFQLSIVVPNTAESTKGEGTVEDSGVNETGTSDEYQVNTVTVYLFHSSTETYADSFDLTGITLTDKGISDKVVNYSSDNVVVAPGDYNLFAIANGSMPAGTSLLDQASFLAAVDTQTYSTGSLYTVPTGGIIMTNRASDIVKLNIPEPTVSTSTTVTTISLERVLAKVEIDKAKDSFELKDPNGDVYASVNVADFKMVNLATKYYSFRHTAQLNDFVQPTSYSLSENFGDIADGNGYLIDPYFFQKSASSISQFTNADGFFANALVDLNAFESIDWTNLHSAGKASYLYCLENGLYQSAQLNGYTTGVVFRANMTIESAVITEDGKTLDYTTDPVFYFNYKFYESVEAIRKLVRNDLPVALTDTSDADDLLDYNIIRFSKESGDNYTCYYNFWIRHFDNDDDTEMGVMEFGIVRNNIYKLNIASIGGLGSGEPYLEPSTPDEFDAELDINIDVDPWIVRDQDLDLK